MFRRQTKSSCTTTRITSDISNAVKSDDCSPLLVSITTVSKAARKQAEEPPQGFRIDRGGLLHRLGVRQHVQPRSVAWDRSLEQRQVEPFKVLHHVGEGVVRGDVETGVDRSKKEVEIEQDGFLFLGGGQGVPPG